MPSVIRRFPCGDFFPGEEPRPNPGEINTSLPPTYVPSINRPEPVFFPTDVPIGPRGPTSPGGPGSGRPGGGRGGGPGPAAPGGPATTGPATTGPAGPGGPAGTPPRRGPVTPGPGGPATPGPGGPNTGGGRVFRQCTVRIDRCTEPGRTYSQSELERLPIRQILRIPTICTFEKASFDVSSGYPFSFDVPYTDEAKNFCIPEDLTSTDFWTGCVSDLQNNCIDEPSNNQSVIISGKINTSVTQTQGVLAGVEIPNTAVTSQTIIRAIPTRQEEQLNLNDPNLRKQASTSSSYNTTYGLLDERFNFFKTSPQASTVIVANSDYRNIFKDAIPEEVKYFIDRGSTSSVWTEEYFDSLTNDKIILSLRDELLTSFNNINSIGKTKIPLTNFIEIIKNHLITGTLSEFDPNYFYYIYNSQISNKILTLPQQGESYNGLQIAIGLFELSSQSPYQANSDNLISINELKRIRFLLEDIYANIPSVQYDGTSAALYLENAGVPYERLDGSLSGYLDIGDGAGYYVSSEYVDGSLYPLQTVNDLSSARYVPPSLRHNILELLGRNIEITLTVSSKQGFTEFSSSYDPSADISPMYFKLNFDSIADIENPNSVINILSASYLKISDEDAVNHSRNYSFNVTKVNLDYRDPIIHYARDTSTINILLDEFNLRNFDENRSITKENIILRNIPAAIVLTPGMGSAHNPFNSKSHIASYSDNIVTRTITLTPSFETQANFTTKPSLEVSNIYSSLGESYFGLYEQRHAQDIHGNIFTYNPSSSIFEKSYFNGSYSNSQPLIEYRESSIESKIVSLVDKLSDPSSVSSLTWWDVFRRVKINEIGKLAYSDPKTFLNKLAVGWRNDVPILNVLTRYNLRPSGIPEGETIPDDTIIINEWDR